MSSRIDTLLADVKEIRINQALTTVKLAEYNMLLDQHIQGVRSLDARVKPIEDRIKLENFLMKLLIGTVTFGAAIAKLAYYLFKG